MPKAARNRWKRNGGFSLISLERHRRVCSQRVSRGHVIAFLRQIQNASSQRKKKAAVKAHLLRGRSSMRSWRKR